MKLLSKLLHIHNCLFRFLSRHHYFKAIRTEHGRVNFQGMLDYMFGVTVRLSMSNKITQLGQLLNGLVRTSTLVNLWQGANFNDSF